MKIIFYTLLLMGTFLSSAYANERSTIIADSSAIFGDSEVVPADEDQAWKDAFKR